MRSAIGSLFFILLVVSGFSQSQPAPVQNFGSSPRSFTERKSFWTEFNFFGSLTKDKRWQYQIDYQYRRSGDASYIPGGNQWNIFKQAQQQVFRPWVHYWLVPGNLRLSLSPIGYWITWTPEGESATYPNRDGKTSGQSVFPEFRFSPQVTSFHTIGRFQLIQRYRYEFRFLGQRRAAANNLSDFTKGYDFAPTDLSDQSAANDWFGNNHSGRIRIQTRVQVPLNKSKLEDKTWYVNAWNEFFVATGHHVANTKVLNQNRVIVLLGYRFNGDVPIRIEGGVTYQTLFYYNMTTLPSNPNVTYLKNNVENNTAFTVYVVFDEFHNFFKKDTRETN